MELPNIHADMYELNKKLLAKNQMGVSHPMTVSPPQPFETDDLKAFAKPALNTKSKKVSGLDPVNILAALGLDIQGGVTKQAPKESFIQGIRILCDFHFGNYNENKHADIMGELLFSC